MRALDENQIAFYGPGTVTEFTNRCLVVTKM